MHAAAEKNQESKNEANVHVTSASGGHGSLQG
jgi:hypothetical protein